MTSVVPSAEGRRSPYDVESEDELAEVLATSVADAEDLLRRLREEREMAEATLRYEYGVIQTQYGEDEPCLIFDSSLEAEYFAQEELGERLVRRLVSDWESVTDADK